MGTVTDLPPSAAKQAEEAARDAAEEAAEERPGQIEIEASGQLSLSVGGRRPDTGTVKLKGKQIGLAAGQFPKGSRSKLLVTARCGEIDFVDVIDSATGEVVETKRVHVLTVEGVQVVESEADAA